jgi:hypothetical protein
MGGATVAETRSHGLGRLQRWISKSLLPVDRVSYSALKLIMIAPRRLDLVLTRTIKAYQAAADAWKALDQACGPSTAIPSSSARLSR